MSAAAAIAAPQPAPPEWWREAAPVAYPAALSAMVERAAAIRAGTARERVWLLEHPPLYTAGTSAGRDDLRDPDRFPIYDAGRGGQWTYHGPGQMVGYVMLDLKRPHGMVAACDLGGYVRALEEWLIRTAALLGAAAERRPGRVGIWVTDPVTGAEAKLGAIGVRLRQWVSLHGVSLNVHPDLSHFDGIVPCGIRTHGVTSLRALGLSVTMDDAEAALRTAWRSVFANGSE